MKKRISLLLAVVMVLSSFASVFASNTLVITEYEKVAADYLKANDILKGDGDDQLLGDGLRRQDSVVLLSRLMDKEAEAESHELVEEAEKFKDLPNNPYYESVISWGVANDYYKGTSGTTFAPYKEISAQEYAMVLLRALGYTEVEYADAYEVAEELGLLKHVDVKEGTDIVLRKDVALMTYNALRTKMNNLDQTLGDFLGLEGLEPDEEKPVVPEADEWELRIDAPEALKADGLATGIVKFGLYKNGELDTSANKVVLDVNTTYGSLSQKRVTIQNGEAELILRSEFQDKPVIARIDAIIIEAEGEHKDLIGKVVAKPAAVPFNHRGEGTDVVIKQLLEVNSNEADRVTLIFDKEVSLKDFYKEDPTTGYLKLDKESNPILRKDSEGNDVVRISQKGESEKKIKGILIDENNPKVAVVVLDKEGAKQDQPNHILTDNKDVTVNVEINEYKTGTEQTFKLTDARKPNMTGVNTVDNRTLEVSFSEPIHSAEFVIDGRAQGDKDFTVAYGDVVYNSTLGKFVDNRNVVTLTLDSNYQDSDKKIPKGYFKPGMHSVQASNIKDFAALTDTSNIGTTQSLSFKVEEDKTKTDAEVTVESPEQFRIKFNNQVAFEGKGLKEHLTLQVRNPEAKTKDDEWVALEDHGGYDFDEDDIVVTEIVKGREYKVELAKDWTEIYNTKASKLNYYNNKFRLVIAKDSVITVSNGLKNKDEMVLNLSESGSLLTKPDTTSPVIKGIEQHANGTFTVEMSEPVKLAGIEDSSKSDTLAQDQGSLPTTMVEFIGKDDKGITTTLSGKVTGYADYHLGGKKTDRFISVEWKANDKGQTPQTIVNEGGSEDWTIVVKAISDDIGNVAATVTQDFKLKPVEVYSEFRVNPIGGDAIGEKPANNTFKVTGQKDFDKIIIEFTDEVSVVGINAATDVKNYTLNGADLPAGTRIELAKNTVNGKDVVDARTIEIILPKGTLLESNVIVLAEQIESKDGAKLAKDKAFTFGVKAKNQIELEKEAEAAVIKAENSKEQEDIEEAKGLVENLDDKKSAIIKENLQKRLNKLEEQITEAEKAKAKKEAIEAVKVAKESRKQEDIDAARDLVNKLDDKDEKAELISKLDALEEDIKNEEAEEAVKVAEKSRKQEDIEAAQGLVDELEDEDKKAELISKLEALEEDIKNEEYINKGKAEDAVKKLEKKDEVSEEDIKAAQDLIDKVKDENDKKDLQKKLDDIAVTKEVVKEGETFDLDTGVEKAVWVQVEQNEKVVGAGGMTEADGVAKINLTKAGEYKVVVKDKEGGKVLKEIKLTMTDAEAKVGAAA